MTGGKKAENTFSGPLAPWAGSTHHPPQPASAGGAASERAERLWTTLGLGWIALTVATAAVMMTVSCFLAGGNRAAMGAGGQAASGSAADALADGRGSAQQIEQQSGAVNINADVAATLKSEINALKLVIDGKASTWSPIGAGISGAVGGCMLYALGWRRAARKRREQQWRERIIR